MKISPLSLLNTSRRSGAVLVCVLACMLIAISIATSAVHLTMRSARASKQNLSSRQTQWLLQAGVERAYRSLKSGDYSDKEWLVPANQLPESGGRVVIDVAPVESTTDQSTWKVSVTAEYGPSASQLTHRSHSFDYSTQTID